MPGLCTLVESTESAILLPLTIQLYTATERDRMDQSQFNSTQRPSGTVTWCITVLQGHRDEYQS